MEFRSASRAARSCSPPAARCLPRTCDWRKIRAMSEQNNLGYKFSFGPWNIHEGADPFGPPVRPTVEFAKKLRVYKELGFDGVQFHDDDAVPEVDKKSPQQLRDDARAMKKMLDDAGLVAEF